MFKLKPKRDIVSEAYEAEFEGDRNKALKLWKEVVNQQPDNLDAVVNLTELLVENNSIRDAVKTIENVASKFHDNQKVQSLFIDTLIAAKEFERAKRHADLIDSKIPGSAIRKYVDAAEISNSEDIIETETVKEDDWLSSFAGEAVFTKEHAERMNKLFVGRQDVFARMWLSENGFSGYSPVYKPYSPQIVYNHLIGNYTSGIYLTKTDGATRILAFDIDITPEAINSARGSAEKAAELRKAAFCFGLKLKSFLIKCGLRPILEDSGYKGAHIWVIFDKWSKCGTLRRLGEALLVNNGNVPQELAVEIFPKQKHKPKKLGNLIKLPLGIHLKTGRRSVFLDDSGIPFGDQPDALMKIRPSDSKLISSLLDKYNLPDDFSVHKKKARPNSNVKINPANSRIPVKRQLITAKEFEADEILNYLLCKCEVLKKLVKRVRTSHLISYEEKLVLEHTLGHFPNGAEIVNFLLKPCGNISDNFLMGKSHKGYPTSCSKIANHVPHIAATCECNCDFGVACANYPTPLNHLYSYVPKTIKALPPPQSEKIRQENNSVDIVKLLSKLYGKQSVNL